MKSDKVTSILYIVAGMIFLVNAMMNDGGVYIPLGFLFIILGFSKSKVKNNSNE